MRTYLAPIALVVGLVAIFAGGFLQAYGAAAIVFCSVIGAGIILAVAGVAWWLVQAFRGHGTQSPVAS